MVSYHKLTNAFQSIGLHREIPAITHIGKEAASKVNGGISTLMGALLSTVDNVLLPAFTFSTMVTPETGPEFNGMQYGDPDGKNLEASFFSINIPSDSGNLEAIEILETFPGIYRSTHPIFSFYGLGLDIALLGHTPEKPYKPISELVRMEGYVLLVDAAPAENFSIHLAEMLAGRKQFLRWALTPDGVAECPHFPGCPNGFHKLDYYLHDELKTVQINDLTISGVAIRTLIDTAVALLREDPFSLLCNDLNCSRCNLIREDVKTQVKAHWKPEDQAN